MVQIVDQTFTNYGDKWSQLTAGSESLSAIRKSKKESLASLVYPNRKVEEWKYTNITKLAGVSFKAASKATLSDDQRMQLSDSKFTNLFIVNGVIEEGSFKEVSKVEGISLFTLTEAYENHAEELSRLDKRLATKYDTPFFELNSSMLEEGFVLMVHEKAVVEKPIKVTYVSINQKTEETVQPKIVIISGERSDFTLVEHFASIGSDGSFHNVVTDIEVRKGARLSHTRTVTEAEGCTHISAVRAVLDSDAVYTNMNACLSGEIVRQDLNVILDGKHAEAYLNGIYFNTENGHFDNHLNVIHRMPEAKSRQVYKGAMGGKSRGVFNGKIIIERDAQLSDAGQINKNLLLSDTAEIDTKPELWVDADDVKAAHGATVSQIDENEIFYLQTRGIDKVRAKNMLSRGFVEEVVYKETNDDVRGFVDSLLSLAFAGKSK